MKLPQFTVRTAIYCISLIVAITAIFCINFLYGSDNLATLRYAQVFGGLAALCLYLCLLAKPLILVFPNMPGRAPISKSRKALGLCSFYFVSIHGYISFFTLLGGIEGLSFLSRNFLISVIFGITALLILLILAATSIPFFVRLLGKNWKRVHRLIYASGVLVLFHMVIIGSHYIDLQSWTSRLTLGAVFILLVLQALRFDLYRRRIQPNSTRYSSAFIALVILITIGYTLTHLK